jgi:hypothetical protein
LEFFGNTTPLLHCGSVAQDGSRAKGQCWISAAARSALIGAGLGDEGSTAFAAKTISAGVDVHPTRSEKADERLPTGGSEINGQARWSGDGCDHWDPGRESFLHHLERDASAEQQDAVAQWEAVLEQCPADQLIQRIVAAHILARGKQVTTQIE